MERKIKTALGVSITENFLRVAKVKAEKGKISVYRLGEFVINSPSDSEGKEKNSSDLIKRIKHSLKKLSLTGRAFISPDDREVILKDKVLPPVSRQEIFKLIESEIKDYAIFGHENVSLGFNIVKREQNKIAIIWAGLKESILMNTLRFVKSVGVKPVAVIPSNFAITKFILHFYGKESKNFVVLNVDNSVTSLTFVNAGKVVLNYKHDVGLSDISGGALDIVNNWVGNILTTITFVSRNRKIPIERIFLISQGGNSERLFSYLSARISYPIIVPDLKRLVNFTDEEDFLRVQKTGGSEFVTSVGLALLEISGQRDPAFCDISKHILVEKASARFKVLVTSLLLVAVNAAFVYFYPVLSSTLNNLSANLKDTDERIRIVSEQALNTEKFKKEVSSLNTELGIYKSVRMQLDNRAITSSLLSEIKSKLPENVILYSVSVDNGGKISISGSGKTYKDVLNYEVNLASAKFVKNASILEMSKNASGAVVFKMIALSNEVRNEKK